MDEELPPPPPPPPPPRKLRVDRRAEKEAKKAWSKPSITLIDDIIYTEDNSNPNSFYNESEVSYGPPTS